MGELIFFIIVVLIGCIIWAFLYTYWVPIVIAIGIIVTICVLYRRSVKNKVQNGRLTLEIINDFKEKNARDKLHEMIIEPNCITAYFEDGYKQAHSYNVTKKLGSLEMEVLTKEIAQWLGNGFQMHYRKAIESGGVNIPVGSYDGKKIYKHEYIDEHPERWQIIRKPVVVTTPKTKQSNW